jgi:ketosteroid isomerase-like protein
LRQEMATLVRAAMSVSAINAPSGGEGCRGEQAFVELVLADRSTSATRACVAATDPIGRVALRLSEAAGSRTEEELAAAAIAEVMAADRAFAAMAQAEGASAAFARYAASDAIMLRGEGAPTIGHEAVVASFAEWPPAARLQWAPEAGRVSARGDMAWTWGNSTYTAADGARTPGRYISVWTRDYDGNWRFAFDASVR